MPKRTPIYLVVEVFGYEWINIGLSGGELGLWLRYMQFDLLIDNIPTRREFNAALEKTASNVAGVLTKFDDFVSNTANEIIESKSFLTDNFK